MKQPNFEIKIEGLGTLLIVSGAIIGGAIIGRKVGDAIGRYSEKRRVAKEKTEKA